MLGYLKNDSIQFKVLLPLALILLLAIAGMVWSILDFFKMQVGDLSESRVSQLRNTIDYIAELSENENKLIGVVQTLGAERDIKLLAVVDGDSNILIAASKRALIGKERQVLYNYIPSRIMKSIVAREDIFFLDKEKNSYTAIVNFSMPDWQGNKKIKSGEMFLVLDTSGISSSLVKHLQQVFLVAIMTIMVVLFVLYWMLNKHIFGPLFNMIEGLKSKIDEVDGEDLIKVHGEINWVQDSINRLFTALHKSQELFRAMANSIPAIAWLSNQNNQYTFVNKYGLDFFDSSLANITHEWQQKIHEEDRENAIRIISDAVKLKKDYSVEYRIERHDGEYRWVVDYGIARFNSKGEYSGYSGVCMDITQKIFAQQDLLRKQEEQQMIFDNVPVRIWYKDDKNNILRLNKQAAESMGMTVEQAEGRDVYELFPDIAGKYHQDDLEVINTGQPKLGIVEEYIPRDGQRGWVQTDKVPYHDVKSGRRALFVVAQDITQLKQVEQALRDSEKRFQLAVDGTAEGIWDWPDIQEDDKYWSPRFKELLGYQEEEIKASYSAFMDLLHPADIQGVAQALQDHFFNKRAFDMESRLQMKTGEYRWFHIKGNTLRNEKNEPIRMAGAITDIQDRKEDEEVLKALYSITSNTSLDLNEKIQLILQTAADYLKLPIGIVSCIENDKYIIEYSETPQDSLQAGTILNLSDTYCACTSQADSVVALHKINSSDFMQYHFYSEFKLESYIAAPLFVDGCRYGTVNFSGNEPRKQEFRDREKTFVQVVSQWIGDEMTQALQINRLLRVEENLENMVDKLTESNIELERFAYVAAHDFKEPIRMVQSFTSILNTKYLKEFDEQDKQFVAYVLEAAQRMQSLIDDLLDYSKIESEADKREQIDFGAVVTYALDNLKDCIASNQAKIHYEGLPVISANPVRLTRLLQNLIQNAIKYQAPGKTPEIFVEFEEQDQSWIFSIKDNGIGMREEYLKKIFKPFKRLHAQNEYSGTGIGLSVCKKVVNSWGGKIWAESTLGEGSEFYFTIPKESPDGVKHDSGQAA